MTYRNKIRADRVARRRLARWKFRMRENRWTARLMDAENAACRECGEARSVRRGYQRKSGRS